MFSKTLIVAAIASLVAAAPTPAGAPASKRSNDSYGNMATYYDAETGAAGACGNMLSNNDRFVAVGFNSPLECGQWLGFNVNGKTSYGYVADKCESLSNFFNLAYLTILQVPHVQTTTTTCLQHSSTNSPTKVQVSLTTSGLGNWTSKKLQLIK